MVYLYVFQDLLVAAIETTGVTTEWAMSELLKNPKTLRKATEELQRVIGRERWVEERDLINLPYMEVITKESMRLHPASPMLPPRVATNGNSKVLGFDIPEGTQVLVNAWAIGRDPTIWENPNDFYPERFIGMDIGVIGNNFELLPFGAGRRICPGYPLALKVVQMTLANLVHGFSWSLPNHMKEVDLNMEETYRLTGVKKQPLEVVIKPRLLSHIYL